MIPDSIIQPYKTCPEVYECFKYVNSIHGHHHYFQQRSHDVLHVINGELINSLHARFLCEFHEYELSPASPEEFRDAIRRTIYLLEIEPYWN